MDIIFIFLKAFLVGGLFCAIGQVLLDKTKLTPARILSLFVVAGVFLSAIGVYKPLLEWSGAGAAVPLTGFGHILTEGVRKAVAAKGIVGAFTGGFTAAAAGIATAVFFGLMASLVFKSKDKS